MKVINKTGSIRYYDERIAKRSLYIELDHPGNWDPQLLYTLIDQFFGPRIESITLTSTNNQNGARATRQQFDLRSKTNREMTKPAINKIMIMIEALAEYFLPVQVVDCGHRLSNGVSPIFKANLKRALTNNARDRLLDAIMDTIDQIREEKLTNENR